MGECVIDGDRGVKALVSRGSADTRSLFFHLESRFVSISSYIRLNQQFFLVEHYAISFGKDRLHADDWQYLKA